MIGWCPDYIYYIKINEEILGEHIFSTRSEANNFAKENGIKNYSVLEWDAH